MIVDPGEQWHLENGRTWHGRITGRLQLHGLPRRFGRFLRQKVYRGFTHLITGLIGSLNWQTLTVDVILFMSTGDQLVRILWCCQWTQWTSLDLTVRSLNVYFEVSFLGWVCLNGLQHNLYSRCLQRSLFLISKKPFWVKILLCHPAPCGTSALGPHSFWGAKWNSWSNVMSRNDLILLSNLKLHVYVCKSYWFIQTLPKITPTDWHCSTHLSILPSNLFRTSELWW